MSRDTLHLLLLTETQNEAENIVSLLRNAGNATRAHHVQSLQDFLEQLQAKAWDMVIAFPQVKDVKYEDLLAQIKRFNLDLPVILLAQDTGHEALMAAMRAGAKTIAPLDENNLFLLLFQQELNNLFARRDIRELEARLRDSEKRSQSLLESSKDAIAYILDGMHIYGNKNYLDLFGYSSNDELEGIPILDMIDGAAHQEFKQFLRTAQLESNEVHELSTHGKAGDGKSFNMKIEMSPAVYEDEECTLVRILMGSDDKELEAKLEKIKNQDQLTGLYNKIFFHDRLEDAVNKAVRKGMRGALLYINLDHFGKTLGDIGVNHADTIIMEVADFLKKATSNEDVLARAGEDIFYILRMDCDAESATAFAEDIQSRLAQLLIEIDNRTITMVATIGISLITDSNSRPNEIIQQAHNAHRLAFKNQNGQRVQLFVAQESTNSTTDENGGLEKELIAALKANSFSLLYQPMISLQGADHDHYEAYLKLKSADDQLTAIDELFNNASISDDVKRKVDRWQIYHVAKQLTEYVAASKRKTRVLVSVSAASIIDETLPSWIESVIRAARLPHGSIVIQLHENDITVRLKQAQSFTLALLEKKILSSIHHFGGALNPMQALEHLTIEYIKIDNSFTEQLNNEQSQKALKDLLEKLHKEDKSTIIPDVDNASAMATLWQTGAHFLQGRAIQEPQDSMNFSFEDI